MTGEARASWRSLENLLEQLRRTGALELSPMGGAGLASAVEDSGSECEARAAPQDTPGEYVSRNS